MRFWRACSPLPPKVGSLSGTLLSASARMLIFRGAPYDLPNHPQMLGLAITFNALASGLVMMVAPIENFVLRVGYYLLFTLALNWVYVRLRGVPERWQQTVAALLATDALITVLASPLYAYAERITQAGGTPGPDFQFMLLGLILWGAVVAGNIYRHALGFSWPVALGISFASTLLSIFTSALLFADA